MEMTKEIMYDQFKTLKSNNEKVKYLVDLKELKQKTPHVFRNIKISIKNFNNLIRINQLGGKTMILGKRFLFSN